ncbi:MAG: lipopolysaccharide heptosyltransferase II [Candidatus Omnitrophica bacterium]|nr:lipopolysaccharide heptosyltransferase II [Candidatus Omnitrophota bacterium]
MKIIQLLPRLEVGGVERGTVELSAYLAAQGHQVIVISYGGALVKQLEDAGVRHYKLPVHRKDPLTILWMMIRLTGIIRKERVDIVHARSRVPALIGFMATRWTHTIFITTAHGQYRKHLMSHVMGWGRYVIVASNAMAAYMAENFGVRPDTMRVIPRGVDTNRFAFIGPQDKPRKAFTVSMIARMTPLKGHSDFIKACSVLARSLLKLRVVIAGPADTTQEYFKQLKLLTKSLGLSDIVEFAGAQEDVTKILARSDVLVVASRDQEAFGRVVIEAQSMGVPVVATRTGGIPEIITDGETGFLCEPGNPTAMAQKIMKLYRDMDTRIRIAKNARLSVESKFTLEKMLKSTEALYYEARDAFRILVVKLSSLGDVILSTPSLKAIRKRFPQGSVKVLVGKTSADVLKEIPFINGTIVADLGGAHKGLLGFLRLGRRLREENFDMVIDFQNSKKSHILGWMSGAYRRYGYDNGKLGILLTNKVKDSGAAMDPVDHQLKVLNLLGINDMDKEPALFPANDDRLWADRFLKDHWMPSAGPLVCMHLEASSRWVSKRWPVSHFVKLSEKLARELSIRVMLTGQNPDDDWNRNFFKHAKTTPVSAVGKTTIGQLMALIEKSSLLITLDSAPMHVAAGVKTPFIALFGPTDPVRHVPPASQKKVFFKKKKCSPCYRPTCEKGYVCMRSISPDEVFQAVKDLLGSKEPGTQ